MAKLISPVVNYSRLSACQGDMEPFEGNLSTRECLTSHGKSRLGNFQHQHLSELLVNVYSYCLMVKSVLMLCASKVAFLKSGHILCFYSGQLLCTVNCTHTDILLLHN